MENPDWRDGCGARDVDGCGARDVDGILKLEFRSEEQNLVAKLEGNLSPEATTAVCFSDI